MSSMSSLNVYEINRDREKERERERKRERERERERESLFFLCWSNFLIN